MPNSPRRSGGSVCVGEQQGDASVGGAFPIVAANAPQRSGRSDAACRRESTGQDKAIGTSPLEQAGRNLDEAVKRLKE